MSRRFIVVPNSGYPGLGTIYDSEEEAAKAACDNSRRFAGGFHVAELIGEAVLTNGPFGKHCEVPECTGKVIPVEYRPVAGRVDR